ncbi:MAG: carboxypeptidase regulatory-like domain-containing protein [Phaeodactylibacter sp.]|nr:carboxypeptidase regulatory-like domain-containing protein [Phaeodactylibacter sp.]
MKQLLPLMIFACAALGLPAQNVNLTVSGTVANTSGEPVEGVQVQIFTDSLSTVFIYYNSVATDAQGQYSDAFSVPGNFTQGALYVVLTDCNGYQILQTLGWNPGNTSLNADFTYCDVQGFCEVFVSDSGGGQLQANPTGATPYAFQWSTGETTQSILPNATGVYCVTVTDAAGCTASSCYDFGNPIDTSCYVYISLEGNTGAGLLVEAVGTGGVPPYTYAWSTGETTASVVLTTSGTYCVTLTDANGCESSACYTIPPAENHRIQGFVYLADSTSTGPIQGEVYLIQYDNTSGTLTALDTVPILSTAFSFGSYDFGDVPAGEYLIKAALSPGSFGYADNLPTYYGNVLWWDEATSVTVPYSGQAYFSIVLVEGDNPGGPGFIGGLVTDGANFGAEPIEGRGGQPLAGVSMILLDEFGQPVTYAYSDADGAFEFPGLAWGTYEVVLELPGHEQASYRVTLGPDNPAVHGLTFEVTEAGILSVDAEGLPASLQLFPVPARESLSVVFESREAGQILLFINDFSGRALFRQVADVQPGVQQFRLNIGNLPAGVYSLGILGESGLAGKQFIKE